MTRILGSNATKSVISTVALCSLIVLWLGINNGFIVIRFIINAMAAIGMLIVANVLYRNIDDKPVATYAAMVFVGVAGYNFGAGAWFLLVEFGFVTPGLFWLKHTYTILNALETIPALLFIQYIFKQE